MFYKPKSGMKFSTSTSLWTESSSPSKSTKSMPVLLLTFLLVSFFPLTSAFTLLPLAFPTPPLPLSTPSSPILIPSVLTSNESSMLTSEFTKIYSSTSIPISTSGQITSHPLSSFPHLSSHSTITNPISSFNEGLLSSTPLGLDLTLIRDSLFDEDDLDWFSLFPEEIRPEDCMILSGSGASSTFHRDPFEWTGTSLLLQGEKIWRFIKSTPKIEQLLEMESVVSEAWGDLDVSAGYQSPHTLYKRVDSFLPATFTPTPSSGSDLRPDLNLDVECYEVLQKPGDIIIIPKDWIHQTYSINDTISCASQRCGVGDVKSVLGHMAERVGVELNIEEEFEYDDAEGILGRVFESFGIEY